jgi:hypothetical protein
MADETAEVARLWKVAEAVIDELARQGALTFCLNESSM